MSASPSLHGLLADPGPPPAAPDLPVRALRCDSREIEPGDLFFARAGARVDARRFIDEACEAGAAAVVYEGEGEPRRHPCGAWLLPVDDLAACLGRAASRFHGHPSRAMQVVGVTGTNGKTSLTHFVAQALARIHGTASRCAVLGTLGYGPLDRLAPAPLTTPAPLTLHRRLAELRAAGVRQVAMEASSHALAQGRVAGVAFTTAAFTNLSRDHLDYHRDMAAYARSKRRLFESEGLRFAVLNLDDAFGRRLRRDVPVSLRVLGHRLTEAGDEAAGAPPSGPGPEIAGRLARLDASGLVMRIHSPWGEGVLRSPLLGRFNARNLLGALAVLLSLDVALDAACRALSEVGPVRGRMQCLGGGGRAPLVVVDYAHTPDALENALRALREHSRGRLWCVFGCGGDRDRGKRPRMGAVASALADSLVLTDDNPRGEDGGRIVEEIRAGAGRAGPILVERDRLAALRFVVEHAADEDVVLVAGKGHETWQEIAGVRRPFDDAAEVARLLRERAA